MSVNQMLVLNRADLESLGLTWPEIIDVLDDAFQQKARGLVQNPPKPKVTSRDDAFIHAMPAYLGGSDRIGIKWVAGYEQNHAKGLPYIYGAVIMNDARDWAADRTARRWLDHRDAHARRLRRDHAACAGRSEAPGHRGLRVAGSPPSGGRAGGAPWVDPCDGVRLRRRCRPAVARQRRRPGDPGRANHPPTRWREPTWSSPPSPSRSTRSWTAPTPTRTRCCFPWTTTTRWRRRRSTTPSSTAWTTSASTARSPTTCTSSACPSPTHHLAEVVAGRYDVPVTGRRMFLNMGIAMDDVALSSLVLDRAAATGVGRYIEFP